MAEAATFENGLIINFIVLRKPRQRPRVVFGWIVHEYTGTQTQLHIWAIILLSNYN